jgi:hypothetical protein
MRLCISVATDGVKVYGDSEAFKLLASKLIRIAHTKPSEHFEIHTLFHLQDYASVKNEESEARIWTIVDSDLEASFPVLDGQIGFELTYMIVTESELDSLQAQSEFRR